LKETAMNNLQQRIAVVLLRWPWEPGPVPHGWDIQGQLRRQGREVALGPIVAAREALAAQQAIRISAQTAVGNRLIREAFPVRLQEIAPG
jgi:hypothetical protein